MPWFQAGADLSMLIFRSTGMPGSATLCSSLNPNVRCLAVVVLQEVGQEEAGHSGRLLGAARWAGARGRHAAAGQPALHVYPLLQLPH